MPEAGSRWPILVLTEPIGSGSRRALAERAADRGGLDRIAGRRAGAVHLEKREVVGRDAGALADRANQRRLRRLARQRQADRAAVGIDAGAEDHGAHAVAVGQRLRRAASE